jgi:hypothetical protein
MIRHFGSFYTFRELVDVVYGSILVEMANILHRNRFELSSKCEKITGRKFFD